MKTRTRLHDGKHDGYLSTPLQTRVSASRHEASLAAFLFLILTLEFGHGVLESQVIP